MGYGLGACIGAKMGRPDKICINIGGDGCFRMNMNELGTKPIENLDYPGGYQQPCTGYGAPVADSVLRSQIFPDRAGGCGGLL